MFRPACARRFWSWTTGPLTTLRRFCNDARLQRFQFAVCSNLCRGNAERAMPDYPNPRGTLSFLRMMISDFQSRSWPRAMCEPIIAKKADGIAGNVELAPYLQRPWMTALHDAWLGSTERLDPLEPLDVGASMAFARNVLDVVPSFDVELDPGALGFGGDTLFSFQLKKAGLKILAPKGPAVLHCFDEKRLSRSNWLRAAKDRGASNAYLDYHWRHQSLSLLPLLFFRNLARYYRRRVLRWRECSSQEGAPEWELHCLAGIHRLVRYSVESKRPRNYYREGLVKIRGVVERPKPLPVLGKSSITSAF